MSFYFKKNSAFSRLTSSGFTPTPKIFSVSSLRERGFAPSLPAVSPSNLSKGFTLVELLISISIVSVILTVLILNQSTYTDGAALANLADEISLTISQAQTYSIAVREFSTGSNIFSSSYGLAFSLLGSGSDKAYIYFADRDGNSIYSGDWSCPMGGLSDECLNRADITRGNYIDSICIIRIAGEDVCDNVSRVDISFLRPNTEAQIFFFDDSGSLITMSDIKGGKITVKSPLGYTRTVSIFNTGQVSVGSPEL